MRIRKSPYPIKGCTRKHVLFSLYFMYFWNLRFFKHKINILTYHFYSYCVCLVIVLKYNLLFKSHVYEHNKKDCLIDLGLY